MASPGLVLSKELAVLRLYRSRNLRLNLGTGPRRLDGFLNIDINLLRKPDLWLDIRKGLPLRDGSASFIYTSHTIEHLTFDELIDLLKECHRVLENDATMRIVVPNLGKAIAAYQAGDASWFSDWPRQFRSVGGKFTNYILCDAQHKCAFDYGLLEELLLSAGFCNVQEVTVGKSSAPLHYWPALAQSEANFLDGKNLFVEGQKKISAT